jgi:ADP-ribosylglycohydrolase
MTNTDRRDRIAGAILAAAIGDALGHPTEFMSMPDIIDTFGPAGVVGFEKWWTRVGHRFAPYTDDTQMAELVARALVAEHHDLDVAMTNLAERFINWAHNPQGGHRAPGTACLSGCRALERGVAWAEAGGATAGGCGSVMRAWPCGLIFVDDVQRAEAWAVAQSRLTHNDPIALAASAAVAVGTAYSVQGIHITSVVDAMVAAAARYSEPTSAMIARAAHEARTFTTDDDIASVYDRLRAWAAHEAIAAATFAFIRHADDPRSALLEGANTPGDSDSIASIAGALVGARCGLRALPTDWVNDVERSAELQALAADIAALNNS